MTNQRESNVRVTYQRSRPALQDTENRWTAAQTFDSTILRVYNPAATYEYRLVGGAITADRNVTFPLLLADDIFVTEAMIQTLTGKTLGAVTLAGVVSGGGQQVNDVIIGTVTPLAGRFTTITGTDTTDATSSTAGAVSTAGGIAVAKKGFFGDLVDITKSGSPYSKAHKAANGPHLARMVGSKTVMTDNVLTSFLRVTIPNSYLGGIIRLDYIANSSESSRYRIGGLLIHLARSLGADTVKGSAVYITEQTLLAAAAETLTVTFSLSALTGAVGATQTFDIEVTIDTSLADKTVDIHYVAELLSAYYNDAATDEITMAAV